VVRPYHLATSASVSVREHASRLVLHARTLPTSTPANFSHVRFSTF
jgi:hypothetical protein